MGSRDSCRGFTCYCCKPVSCQQPCTTQSRCRSLASTFRWTQLAELGLMASNGSSRSILLCVDESSSSDKVFEYCVQNFYRAGDVVHILHVIAPSRRLVVTPDMGLEGVIEDDEETKRKVEEHAQEFIRERFEKRLETLKIPFQVDIVRGCVDNDSIGALVCRRAEQMEAVAVLMAKHSRGPVKEFFIGSVTNYAAHHCKQPVLVLHCDQ